MIEIDWDAKVNPPEGWTEKQVEEYERSIGRPMVTNREALKRALERVREIASRARGTHFNPVHAVNILTYIEWLENGGEKQS